MKSRKDKILTFDYSSFWYASGPCTVRLAANGDIELKEKFQNQIKASDKKQIIEKEDMMIQIQDWKYDKKIVVVDEVNHGTVQVQVPNPGEYKDKYYQHADCAIYNLCVDEKYRKVVQVIPCCW